MSEPDALLILRAADFAARKHRDQRRKEEQASPYINHPIEVARVLAEAGGVTDAEVLAAALLHDTIEDTETTEQELVEHFGVRVSAIVAEVSDDKHQEKLIRKQAQVEHAPHLSEGAALVKLADKTVNVRDIAGKPPRGWSLQRRREYLDWAEHVVSGLPPVSAALRRTFDAALTASRARLDGHKD